MKHKLLPVLPLLLVATMAHGQATQQVVSQPSPPTISTNGSAEIHVKPDVADLSFEIEIRNLDLTTARKQQAAITAKLLAALRAAGIEEKDLNASQVSITPAWNERRGVETSTVRFYSVSQAVTCTVHDVDKVPELTTAAITAGATNVSPAVFRTTDLRKYRDQARQMAIRAAKEKAEALAGELGSKVGKPYTINESEASYYRFAGNNGFNVNSNTVAQVQVQNDSTPAAGGDEALSSFAPGTITVTANIAVTFYLD